MEYHKKIYPKYIQLTFPLIGYVSGGLMKIAISDVYTYYVNKKPISNTFTFKNINNVGAYIGFVLGLTYVYRGKPLLHV